MVSQQSRRSLFPTHRLLLPALLVLLLLVLAAPPAAAAPAKPAGVGPAEASTTTVTTSPNPSITGQSVTITATVVGLTTPTGLVQFMDGATPIGMAPLDATGTAVMTTSSLTAGVHAIMAMYSGDQLNDPSTGSTMHAVLEVTTTTLTTSPNPCEIGKTVTMTATVSAAAGMPAGLVAFVDGTTPLGTAPVINGVATYSTSTLSLGIHNLVAAFIGSTEYAPSNSSSVTQVIIPPLTTTIVTASPNPSFMTESVTITATVLSSGGVPTGVVTFYDGSTLLGGGLLINGVATLSVSSLSIGNHTLAAWYASDGTFLPSFGMVDHQVAPLTLTLGKTDNQDQFYAGWFYPYNVTIMNPTRVTATNIVVTDTLPVELLLERPLPPACTEVGKSIVCRVPSLAAGATETLQIWVRSVSHARGTFTNSVSLTADYTQPASASDDTFFVEPPAGPTPTATPTEPPTPTPTATPTSTPVPDLTIRGTVWGSMPERGASAAGAAPVVDARVAASACGSDEYAAQTGTDGRYELTVPASAMEGCDVMALRVSAVGYREVVEEHAISELRENPEVDVDFTLQPAMPARGWLPLLLR